MITVLKHSFAQVFLLVQIREQRILLSEGILISWKPKLLCQISKNTFTSKIFVLSTITYGLKNIRFTLVFLNVNVSRGNLRIFGILFFVFKFEFEFKIFELVINFPPLFWHLNWVFAQKKREIIVFQAFSPKTIMLIHENVALGFYGSKMSARNLQDDILDVPFFSPVLLRRYGYSSQRNVLFCFLKNKQLFVLSHWPLTALAWLTYP